MYCFQCGSQNPDEANYCLNCGTRISTKQETAMVVYAGFWRRFVAYLIDRTILAVPMLLIVISFIVPAIITMAHGLEHTEFSPQVLFALIGSWLWFVLLILAIFVLYFAWFESSRLQATPGKLALGIIVTDMEGKRITFLRAVGRNAGKLFSHFIFHLGFIMAGLTQKKQALHDMLADCLVVMKKV
jgi:uncharacterized RDD family membrane protein YckC